MPKSPAQKDLTITRFELTKRILVVAGLAAFMLLGVVVIRSNPRTGWACVVLFGVMTILGVVDLVQLRNHKVVKGKGTRANVRTSLIWSGTILVMFLFGLLERLLASLATVRMPVFGIWLATFVTTLAFYPFRGEQAEDLPNFKIWSIYCAFMGFASIGMSYVARWLD